MKKIITLLMVVLSWASAHAQDAGSYRLDITVKARDGGANHTRTCTNKFEFHGSLTDGTELPVWTEDMDYVGGDYVTFETSYTLAGNQQLGDFRFFGARNWKNAFDCSANGGFTDYQRITYDGCIVERKYEEVDGMIPYWISTVTFKITPIVYNVFYFGTNNSPQYNASQWYLPANERILIKATEGYTNNLYNWEYQIGSGGWTAFPSGTSGNSVLFSGNDIRSNFLSSVVLANQPVYVRVWGACGMVSNPIQLIPVLNVPTLMNAVPSGQTCSSINDGTIRITLDRALYSGESLSILVNGGVVAANLTASDFDGTYSYTLMNQPPGLNRVTIQTTYNGQPTYGSSGSKVVIVPSAPVITYGFSYLGTGSSAQPNSALWYLPQSTRVTVNVTSGYASYHYNWQYQIGNGSWVPFPTALYSGNTLSFSGNDISSDYLNAVVAANQTVSVRVVSACGYTSSPMQLVPVVNTPGILTSVPTAPSCFAVVDGKIKVTLNRALYPGETVSILVDGVVKASNLTQAQLPGNSYTLSNIAGGAHVISLSGMYNGKPTFTTLSWSVVIPDTPFSFTTTSSDIHCVDGSDGKITITPQGGKAPYIVLLENSSGNIEASVMFGSGSLTNLPADTYMVRLTDSKTCSPRDGAGNLIENMVTISAPDVDRVAVGLVSFVPPAAGQSNGSITVQATGGSGAYSFLWVEINTGVVFPAEPPVKNAAGMTSRLPNIGSGRYQVVVRDSQYPLVDPQTPENTNGCEAIFEHQLVAAATRIAADLPETKADAKIQEFYVTPNPASGRFAASVSLRDVGDFTLTLLNSQGMVVSEQRYSAESAVIADFEVPSANQRGVYLLRLTTAEQSSAVRVLVE